MNRRHRILPSMFNFLGVIIFVKLFLASKSSVISYSTFSLCAFTPALDSNRSVPPSCWEISTRYSLYDNSSNPDQNYTPKHGCDGKDKTPQFQFSLTCGTFPSTVQDNSLLKIICLFSGFNQSFLLSWDDADIAKQDWVARCKDLVVAPIQNCVKKSDSVGDETSVPVLQALGLTTSTLRMCDECRRSNRYCVYVHSREWKSACFCDEGAGKTCGKPDTRRKIIIGVSAGIGSFILAWLIFYFHQLYRRKRLASSSTLVCRDGSDPSTSSKHDLEKSASTHYAATHKFSYKELSEATNSFDTARELGNGGFGTVYFGKLPDGRCVAVKRLYDNHYKRKELFLNEVKILSGLHHQNLVSLYGCTSRHSRELLLVYEYVPNGTVADHLHGHRAKETALTWPIRMSIAIETAEALAYLHAVDPPIIHRDVKTDNILLDSNFRVKVADLGLSRLFPTDATHVSTVPQGTPGYVDPDYHKCYQLTCKSDVYSYGVVLMELISSMPAVDISRHQHEIKLSTLAVNKILKRALHELVDPNLGYGSDSRVTKMIRFIAELGFRCLQEEKDMRPSMEEVVMELKNMEADEFSVEKKEMGVKEVDNQTDDLRLLKSAPPLSPNSVMEKWINSENTTPSTSARKKKALFLSSMWLC